MIRLINGVADVVNNDPAVDGRLSVVFFPDFNVKNAHVVYPDADMVRARPRPDQQGGRGHALALGFPQALSAVTSITIPPLHHRHELHPVIRRANRPSTIRLPPTRPPIMWPTVLNSPSDTSEPKSR